MHTVEKNKAFIFLVINKTSAHSLKALKASLFKNDRSFLSNYACAQNYLKNNKKNLLINEIELPQNDVKLTLDHYQQVQQVLEKEDNQHLRILLQDLPDLKSKISDLNPTQKTFFTVLKSLLQNKENTILPLNTSIIEQKDLSAVLAVIKEHSKKKNINFFLESSEPEYILDIIDTILVIHKDFSIEKIEMTDESSHITSTEIVLSA